LSFFENLGQKIIKTLFGFTPYDGDVTAVCFSNEVSDILREGYNISYATRVDRWKGYTYDNVSVSTPKVKLEYNKPSVISILCLWVFLFLAGVAGTVVYFLFRPATFFSVFVCICGLLLLIMAVYISLAVALLKINAGERYYGKAKEIKKEKKK
jgi:hypothetical protein